MAKIINLILNRLQFWDLSYDDIETLLYKNGIEEDIYTIRQIMNKLIKEKKVYRKRKGKYVIFTLNNPKKKSVKWKTNQPIVEQKKLPVSLPDTPVVIKSTGVGKVTGKTRSAWETFIDLAKLTKK